MPHANGRADRMRPLTRIVGMFACVLLALCVAPHSAWGEDGMGAEMAVESVSQAPAKISTRDVAPSAETEGMMGEKTEGVVAGESAKPEVSEHADTV